MTTRRLRTAVALGALCALATAAPTPAGAFLYWANFDTIGRANLDGTGVDQSFMSQTLAGGVAVDGAHVYWSGNGAIGRSNLDGSSPDSSYMTVASGPLGLAADYAHLYWSNFNTASIGRANLDGTGTPQQSFITGTDQTWGVAVDAGHVYWSVLADTGAVGRADINGFGAVNDYIGAGSFVTAVAVDGQHVYWADAGDGTIGRADLGDPATNVKRNFITGASYPKGIAVDAKHIYWTNYDTGTIGRANLDGAGVNQSFITGGDHPFGIALDTLSVPDCQGASASTGHAQAVSVTLNCSSGGGVRSYSIVSGPAHGQISGFSASGGSLTYMPDASFFGDDTFKFKASNPGASSPPTTATVSVAPASNDFSLGKAKRNRHNGTARLPVTVPGAGSVDLSGAGLKPASEDASGAGKVDLPVKAAGKTKKRLNKSGKAKVGLDVTFTPIGGPPKTESEPLKLVRK